MRILLVLTLLLATIGVAAAQPTAEEKKEAKAAFQRAEAAERRKDWRTAIDEYQRAYDLAPHPDVLYNIAVDLERLEEYRDAATHYRRYLDESADPNDAPRVEALIDKLRARPGVVTITSEPAGAEVTIDGKRAGDAPVEKKLAGTHRIAITTEAGTAQRDVTVEFGEPQTVHLSVTARSGTLVITSNVPGARVTIDDQDAGVTPMNIALTAGSHRVVVAAEGWSSYERTVDIHPEGTSQMTANLVRPLGYVEPAPVSTKARGFISIGGGADATGDSGAVYALVFGVHRGHFDLGLGYGALGQGAAFALEARGALTMGKIRPYVGSRALIGSASAISGHAGVLFQIKLAEGARAKTSVFLDAGIGVLRTNSGDTTEEPDRHLFIPITGGVMLSY